MNITQVLKFIYYLNIALLPGLAVIGYALANLQGKIPDVDNGMAGFTLLVMAFMSIFAMMSVNAAKYPKSDLTAFIAIIDTPVALLVMYFWGLEINFLTGCVMAFVVEMNALVLSTSLFKITHTKASILKNTSTGESSILYGYLLVNAVLLNFTMYGLYFWNQVLIQTWWQVIPLAYAFLETTYFYYNSFKKQEVVAKGGEAVAVLGPEFVSGVVLVPTWGMGLIGYPLLFLFVYAPADTKKEQQNGKAEVNEKIAAPKHNNHIVKYNADIFLNKLEALPISPSGNAELCKSTDIFIQTEHIHLPNFKERYTFVSVDYKKEHEKNIPTIQINLSNYPQMLKDDANNPRDEDDAKLIIILKEDSASYFANKVYPLSPKHLSSVLLITKAYQYDFKGIAGEIKITYISREKICGNILIKTTKERIEGAFSCDLK